MRRRSIVSLSFLTCMLGFEGLVLGQDINALNFKYPFLKLDQNKITFYGNQASFDSIFNKIDQMTFEGTGKLKILHIGGSHVQGGALQHHTREGFNAFLPGFRGERGFFFPYLLAETNMPEDYKVKYTGKWTGCRSSVQSHKCDWGVSGISAITKSVNATIRIKVDGVGEDPYFFKKARVYYAMKPESYEVALDTPLIADHITIDSVGQFVEFDFSENQEVLKIKLDRTNPSQQSFTIQGIEFLNGGAGITYHTLGVNGAKVSSYLKGKKFNDQMSYLKPDLVLIGLGINDANVPAASFDYVKYEQEYDSLITMFRSANPNVKLIFFTNNDSYYRRSYPNKNIFKVREVMVRLAGKYNGAVWDFFEIMGGLSSIFLWEKATLAKRDYIHLTAKGYQLQAELFLNAFKNAYIEYASKVEN